MLTTHPLTPHIGTEISGIDLSGTVAPAIVDEVLHILDERGVVIMRNQNLTLENFMAFSRSLGPLDVHPLRKFSRPGFPELMINSNIIENGQPIGLADAGQHWHTDGAYLEKPYRITLLYGVEIPVQDGVPLGDTIFTSTSAAYDALEPALRERLSTLKGINVHGVGRKKYSATPLDLGAELSKKIQSGIEHPVVRTHPYTGRKCIYVNPGCTSQLAGMSESESDALLQQLYEHTTRDEFIYRHRWQVGDIVMWDNCSTQHRAVGDYALPLRRLIYRTIVQGTPVQ